jgi:hydroxymethylbilane synthase
VTERFTVGTRRSMLARAQTALVVRALARRRRSVTFEERPIETSGDRDLRPAISLDFTDAIDRALLRGEVDLAVHSAKDLPVELPSGLTLAACPRRGDPRDCLVLGGSGTDGALPLRARVGSSSVRRRAQLLAWRPDLEVVELRGNVDSRLRRVRDGEVDAAIVALAGVRRLGRAGEVSRVLPLRTFLPAPAQGALAVVVRAGDRRAHAVARSIDHAPSRAAVTAERAFARALGSDCRTPLAAHARVRAGRLELTGEVLSPDGRARVRGTRAGAWRRPAAIGSRLGASVLARGGSVLLRSAGR